MLSRPKFFLLPEYQSSLYDRAFRAGAKDLRQIGVKP
jgi:hypothetical protein